MKYIIQPGNGRDIIATDNAGWYRHWFDSAHYRKLYGNRDEKEAAAFIDALVLELEPPLSAMALDLGCGHGRHARQLALKGLKVTGLDLASSSICEAKKSENDQLHFYKHDMRIPFGANCFDYVFNFFTSFGYFKKHHQNFRVISNISDSLKSGGILVMDYLNMHYAEKRLVPAEEKEIDGIIYSIERWSDDSFFYKKITIGKSYNNFELEFVEQVAKLNLFDFEYMFSSCGLQMERIYGDYQLNRYHRNFSPRLIIQAKKMAAY